MTEPSYRVVRFYFNESHPDHRRTIATGLTLEQAQAHCKDPATHGGTAATGTQWFDGYERECEPDDTESVRRAMLASGQPHADLAAHRGQTWTTQELTRDFHVEGFAAPFVVVRRKSDGVRGSLEFTHSPRVYFGWTEA